MPKTRHNAASEVIGRTLKSWRETRNLTLREVAQEARNCPEPIGFDYLSRLERGALMPSVPKLSSLAAVYGRPLSELVDLYEIEQLRGLVPKRRGYEVLRKLGKENLTKGNLTQALACFLGALDEAKREGRRGNQLAQALNNVGGALVRAERYLIARPYLEEGLKHPDSPHTRARLFNNLAIVHYHLDNLPMAELLSRESYELGVGDESLRPLVRSTRACVLLDLKRFAEADRLLREAVDEYEKAGNEVEAIRNHYNLGYCLVEQGEVEDGLRHLRLAVGRAAKLKNTELQGKSLMFFGRSLYKAGRKDEAVGPLLSAHRIAEKNNIRNEAFHSAYYLWLLASEREDADGQEKYFAIARQQRIWLQQRTEEAVAFDREAETSRQQSRPQLPATAH